MFIALIYLEGILASALNSKLSILVSRVKGERAVKPVDSFCLETIEEFIDEVYHGIPEEIVLIEKAYVRPTLLWKQHSVATGVFGICVEKCYYSRQTNKQKSPEFNEAKQRLASFIGKFHSRISPYLFDVSELCMEPAESAEWSSLLAEHSAGIAALNSALSPIHVSSRAGGSDYIAFGTALRSYLNLSHRMDIALERLLKVASFQVLKQIADDQLLKQLLLVHRRLDLRLIAWLSTPITLCLEEQSLVAATTCLCERLNRTLHRFEVICQSSEWDNYRQMFRQFAELWKRSSSESSQPPVRRLLLERQIALTKRFMCFAVSIL